ncbi:MAG: HNH endonuclease [Dethiobacter sp.]|nr:HNH endonuclease [Dethiobacter sp.]
MHLIQDGRIRSTRIYHVKPLAHGGTNDDDNLMSLCASHHSEITAREGGRWG